MRIILTKTLTHQTGFTLVEALVVVAVIGVLASIMMVAIDPQEQTDRANDAKRKQAIDLIANTAAAYQLQTNQFPDNGTWQNALTTNSDLKQIPPRIGRTINCADNQVNGFCYDKNVSGDVVIYTILRSKVAAKQAGCSAAQMPHFYWQSTQERMDITCADPAVGLNP